MSKWTPIVVLIVLAAALVLGCSQEQAETEVPPAVEEAVEEAGEMVEGEVAMLDDPVCGMKVAADTELKVEHDGVTYGFCSEGCRDTFVAGPAAYIQ